MGRAPYIGIGLTVWLTGCGLLLDARGDADGGVPEIDAADTVPDAFGVEDASLDTSIDASLDGGLDAGLDAGWVPGPYERLTELDVSAPAEATNPADTRGGLAPAGVMTITATFTNISDRTFVDLYFEVVTLTGWNLLLNADGAPGGVGSRLTPPISVLGADGLFTPGETISQTFEIGLQSTTPFVFEIDVLARPLP